ncbi:GtrA family protein [Bradyrhizobium sp. CCGUVB4N]|uniref:GtrA family protein n=1 Tax=Bradyrhizobium sp. CCGUVB4N TaxID=2949631 RepID=UPI0020B19A46|nr:GtrA family protein [Bradyrhizobium sp. CCGUVB4N]MCP3384590.1 GtrA family protein [Bradyrhizobium sp. CCGUVB4N]
MVASVRSQAWDALKYLRQHETKIRFLLAGALNTAFGLAAYPSLFFLLAPLKLHYMVVLGITQVTCVTFSYLTNKFLVFRTSGNYLRESGKFASFHLGYFLLNLVALPFLVEVMGASPVCGQTFFAFAVVVTSYFWHSRITFAAAPTSKE